MFWGGLNGDDFYNSEYEYTGHSYAEESQGAGYESPIPLKEFNMSVVRTTGELTHI